MDKRQKLRLSILLIVISLFSLLVSSYYTANVNTGFSNLTINVQGGGVGVQFANVTLLNVSGSTNETYTNGSSTFNIQTSGTGNVTFYNLSMEDNYSVYIWAPGSFPIYSPEFNVSNGTDYFNYTYTYDLTLETIAPTYSNVALVQGPEQNVSQPINLSITVNGTYSYIKEINLVLNDSGTLSYANIQTFYPAINITDGTFEFGYIISNSSAGDNLSIGYEIIDQNDNANATSAYFFEVTDNIDPEILSVSPADRYVQNGTSVVVYVNAQDSSDSTLDVNVSVLNSTGHYIQNISTTSHSGTVYSPSIISPQYEGNFTLNVTVTDEFENSVFNDASGWFLVDTTVGAVNSVSLSNVNAKQNDIIIVDASFFDNNNLSLDSYLVKVTTNQSVDTYNMVYVSDNDWQYNWTIPFDGDYDVLVNITAEDLSGNVAWNATQILKVDNTIPVVTINSPGIYSTVTGLHNTSLEINYSISESPNTTYYQHGDEIRLLDSSQNHNFTFNVTYPGLHFVEIFSNDSAGNLDYNVAIFFADILLNTTRWIELQNNSNSQVENISIYNSSNVDVSSGWLNVSKDLSSYKFDVIINLSDAKTVNITDLSIPFSVMHMNPHFQISNSSFEANFTSIYGSTAIEYVRFNSNLAVWSYDSLSVKMNAGPSEFDEVQLCSDGIDSGWVLGLDNTIENGAYCEKIPSCNDIAFGISEYCYYAQGSDVYVNMTERSDEQHYTIALVNDTIAPTITSSKTNNTDFTSKPHGNTITFTTNEQANCSYVTNASSSGLDVGVLGTYSTPIGNRSTSSYSYSFLPSTAYLNGLYEINVTCIDAYSNSVTKQFHYHMNDTTSPAFSGSYSPSGALSAGSPAQYFTFTTNEESVCKYSTSTATYDYDAASQYASSNNLTHQSSSFPVEDGDTYRHYVSCKDLNGNWFNTTILFSVADPSSGGGDSGDSGSTGSSYVSQGDGSYEKEYGDSTYTIEYDNATEGETLDISVGNSAYFAVSEVEITLAEDINDSFEVIVSSYNKSSNLPTGVSDVPNTYQYIAIDYNGDISVSDIESGSVEFRIYTSFLENLNITSDNVTILKFDGSKWVEAEDVSFRTTSTYTYATTDDLSSLYSITYSTAEISVQDFVDSATVDDNAESESETEDNSASGSTTKITAKDVESSNDTFRNSKSQGEIIFFVGAILGCAVLAIVLLGNKDKLKGMMQAKGSTNMAASTAQGSSGPIKTASSVHSMTDDLSGMKYSGDAVSGDKPKPVARRPATVQEHVLKKDTLETPSREVLVSSLNMMFKNVWVKGYNDKTIFQSFSGKGWSDHDVDAAFWFIFYDAVGEISRARMPSPDIKILVDRVRYDIYKKYGYTRTDVEGKLVSNGWDKSLIDSVFVTLDSEMTLPLDLIDPETAIKQDATHSGYVSAKERDEVLKFISSAKNQKLSKKEIIESLSKAGWDLSFIEELISNNY